MSKHRKTIHEGNGVNRDFIAMTMPLYLMAVFYYGPRVIALALVAVITARIADRLAAMLRSRRYDASENSSVTIALIIVLMMPATVRFRVVIGAVLIAILVAKEAFGGYGSYPFNPAAVGFCAAAVSWPTEMLRYPPPQNWLLTDASGFGQLWDIWTFKNVTLVEGPSATLRAGGLPKLDVWNLLLGNYAGPLGVTCAVVIAAAAIFLLVKRRLPPAAPLCFLGMAALIAFIFPRYSEIGFATFPDDILARLQVVVYELLSGSIVFVAVFLVPEPCTMPKNTLSRVVYGLLLGAATMMFRYFGNYALGAGFAIILVNAVSGYFDRAIARGKPSRTKEVAKL